MVSAPVVHRTVRISSVVMMDVEVVVELVPRMKYEIPAGSVSYVSRLLPRQARTGRTILQGATRGG